MLFGVMSFGVMSFGIMSIILRSVYRYYGTLDARIKGGGSYFASLKCKVWRRWDDGKMPGCFYSSPYLTLQLCLHSYRWSGASGLNMKVCFLKKRSLFTCKTVGVSWGSVQWKHRNDGFKTQGWVRTFLKCHDIFLFEVFQREWDMFDNWVVIFHFQCAWAPLFH